MIYILQLARFALLSGSARRDLLVGAAALVVLHSFLASGWAEKPHMGYIGLLVVAILALSMNGLGCFKDAFRVGKASAEQTLFEEQGLILESWWSVLSLKVFWQAAGLKALAGLFYLYLGWLGSARLMLSPAFGY
ncbi:MAG: hypothetical protein EOM22_05280 [Gammaproteobacteria bacterium]|nr:hypothetical protein [Gammaproteobacteria bacterium]